MDYHAAAVSNQEEKVMNAPHNYYEWVKLFELFKNKINDEETLAAMKAGTIQSLKTNIGARLSTKFHEALNCRIDMASAKFSKDIGNANGDSEIATAMIAFRKEADFWIEVADIPVWGDLRGKIVENLKNNLRQTQQQLEDMAKIDRTGKTLSIVKNHRIID